ncbi:hypothetical protein ACI79J_04245 [Geodermatophilus sp. SYSU D01062]
MVLQILSVIVPLLIALVPLFKWPTLQRRVRADVALVKELPNGMGKQFREAVEEELTELAHRTRTRLGRRAEYLGICVRLGTIATFLTLSVLAYYTAGGHGLNWSWGVVWRTYASLFAYMVLIAIVVAVLRALWRFTEGFSSVIKYRHQRKRARAEGKTILRIDTDGTTAFLASSEVDESVRQS